MESGRKISESMERQLVLKAAKRATPVALLARADEVIE